MYTKKTGCSRTTRECKEMEEKHGYGMRWIAESAFSSIKRTFGEYVISLKWENIINELFLKASLYNMFISKMK
jgi:transposase